MGFLVEHLFGKRDFSFGKGSAVVPAKREEHTEVKKEEVGKSEVTPTARKTVRTYTFLPEDASNPTWKVDEGYVELDSKDSSAGNENLTSDNTDKETAQGEVEEKSNDIEYNTLKGTLHYIATPDTIKIKAGDTIELKNLGKYLSGSYYVQDVTRNVSSNGYSHSATIIKTDFGTSLKVEPTSAKPETATSTSAVIPKDENTAIVETYTVCKGDTPYTIARKKYGDGRRYDRLFDYNTQTRLDVTTQLVVGQVLIVS